MKDGGVIPQHELHVTGKDTTVLHVTIPSSTQHEPEWASVTLVVHNVKEVKVTPVDKNGKPTGEPETTHVAHATTTTVTVTFTRTVKAVSLKVELTKATTTAPVKADVTSVKACLPKSGELHVMNSDSAVNFLQKSAECFLV